MLGDLSKKYESNGNPGTISSGYGDAGGKSYGMYQMASAPNIEAVQSYVKWLQKKNYWFGENLAEHPAGSIAFDEAWRWLAYSANASDFAQSQHEYIKETYYDTAVRFLEKAMYHPEKHSDTMQDVIWSRSVQYGAGYIVEMFESAALSLGYPNLSYVDDKSFDEEMIRAIYLNVCMTVEWTNGSPALRPGLYSRFKAECDDALERLRNES